jgi:hypothetical protein
VSPPRPPIVPLLLIHLSESNGASKGWCYKPNIYGEGRIIDIWEQQIHSRKAGLSEYMPDSPGVSVKRGARLMDGMYKYVTIGYISKGAAV